VIYFTTEFLQRETLVTEINEKSSRHVPYWRKLNKTLRGKRYDLEANETYVRPFIKQVFRLKEKERG
jgi:hypothetical protein